LTASDPPRPLRRHDQRLVSGAAAEPQARERAEPGSRSAEETKTEKERRREEKRRLDAHRPLEAWERYRALVDTLDGAQELVDLADHKARFALLIMGALNAVLFVLGTRTEVVGAIPEHLRGWVGAYLLIYAFVALYFFLQAIESLRPRKSRPQISYPGDATFEDYPMGLRFYEDALRRDVEAYRRAWREVRFGQLNAELAVQAHSLARINHAKYGALQRLYVGLQIMTLMAAVLLTLDAYYLFRAHRIEAAAASAKPAHKVKKAKHGGFDVLGTPGTITVPGAREPSGIVYHEALRRFFLVGDEGHLVELDHEGTQVRSTVVKGNLEDVTVHTPSGNLLMLSEKKSVLVFYDPVAQVELKRWRLDPKALLGQEPGDRNQGFEGVAFREDRSRPGGGLYYLAHQRQPAMVVAMAFDPALPAGPLDRSTVVARFPFPDQEDLTAVTYLRSLDRLLVLTDAKDRVLVLRTDGTLDAEIALPGAHQEGLTFDDAGRLWVADDRAGLLRFDGALGAIAAALRPEAASTEEAERR
jgi:uncharacterized protein YjiK